MSQKIQAPISIRRRLGVAAGLAAVGGAAGAFLGVFLLAVLGLVADGPGGFPYLWEAFFLAAVVGGLLGGVLVPLTTWTLLRHVPFGRVFAYTALGTAGGASAGLLLSGLNPLTAVGGAVAGFGLAALLLRRGSRPTAG